MKTTTLRNWFAIIVTLLCSTSALAYDFEVDGIKYNITNHTEKTVAVTKGKYSKYSGHVIIPDSVTHKEATYHVTDIESRAFEFSNQMTSIDIPNSVVYIGDYAFGSCEQLTGITIPNGVKQIGIMTFFGCTKLAYVKIPNSVTRIGREAFGYCIGLISIEIPNGVTSIENMAFKECTSLTSIEIPKNVTDLGSGIFSGCNNLTTMKVAKENKVYDSRNDCNAIIETHTNTLVAGCGTTVIPNTVSEIGEMAFDCHDNLTLINIPNNVKKINDFAFSESGLTSVKIPESVESIGKLAFSRCKGLTSIEIPNSVRVIGKKAFEYCYGLTSVKLSDNILNLESSTFYGCEKLKSIEIPNKVVRIGNHAFYGCKSLASIIIPKSTKNIEQYAFCLCTNLSQVTCHATEPPICEIKVFEQVPRLSCKLIVPEESVEAYMAANEWRGFYTADGIEGFEDESIVDVYNLQGVKVKKHVRMKDLQGTLPKGIYIINGKKIAVR